MSSGIVTYVSIGAGGAAILAGVAGWLRTRTEVATLQRQQAQSRRMVIPPSVSDVERYAGAKARLRLLRTRTYVCLVVAGLGVVALAAGAIGRWGGRRAAGTAAAPPPVGGKTPPRVDREVNELDRARQLLASLGKLCRAERRRCSRHRKDIGPIVASVCHFHPELCAADKLPAGLTVPSERDLAAAPRVPQSVLQSMTAKVAGGTLVWDDVQLALP